jgi:4-methyl-5(b-hydroxyethyl)-thiazole monophosphate biosynthesis
LVPIANGTEEIEAVTVIDILRRAGIDVVVAGTGSLMKCSRGVNLIPDCLIADIDPNDKFDAIILPGGLSGVQDLANNEHLDMIINKHRDNTLFGAICAAPPILADKEILKDSALITSHPSVKEKLGQFQYSDSATVLDDNIITSRGAGTAMEFALRIVEVLMSKDISDKIASDILYDLKR